MAKPPVHRGDLAFILDVPGNDIDVIFVPRISMERQGVKRKPSGLKSTGNRSPLHRPAQALFDETVVKAAYGESAVTKRGQCFVFNKWTYKNGFVTDTFPITNFSLSTATPTLEELSMFQSCPDITLEDVGIAYFQRFARDDHVKVISGQQKGLVGTVTECNQEAVTIEYIQLGDLQPSTVTLPSHDLRKKFVVGDLIRVIFGEHRGVVGWIIGEVELAARIDDEDATMVLAGAEKMENMRTFPGVTILDDKSMQTV
jgi:transcription elongation factor